MPLKHQGSCRCGAVQVGVTTDPFLKYYCHCSNCRRFVSRYMEDDKKDAKPYNSGGFVWRWSIVLMEGSEAQVEYEPTSAMMGLFAMQRGRCKKCHQPVFAKGQMGICYAGFVFLPTFTTWTPDTNIYYNSGLEQDDGVTTPHTSVKRTYYSDLGSLLGETWAFFTSGVMVLPLSILGLFQTHEFLPAQKKHT